MQIECFKATLKDVLPLRELYLQENNFQIRYNARHERGWADEYIISCDDQRVGYGSVAGRNNISDRDCVFEFFLLQGFRNISETAFEKLLENSKARVIESQSNDLLTTSLLYRFAKNINADIILFEENVTTHLKPVSAVFRKRREEDIIFEHFAEPVGDYLIEFNNEVVATGGYLTHYNFPFCDLYMEVREDQRLKGFGSYLVQEVKKVSYLNGRVPAARTGIENKKSMKTLLKAGFKIAGFMLIGEVIEEVT
ncbi:GNAT family N-acetyltransferase [Pollutibacter soli]|uniref:GNAT family N-acetyltransferase n=1 Tax=Pollutibacter soli TaxID=3034157 RepID=UPI0030132F9C